MVPFRKRPEHLGAFLKHITTYFERDKADRDVPYRITIVEQGDDLPFNGGQLKNIGYLLARDETDYCCFHDVDYLPVWADYSPPECPTRLIWYGADKARLRDGSPLTVTQRYDAFFGAVVLMRNEDVERVNGYSNHYWGWGSEDDDLAARCEIEGLSLDCRDGTFTPLAHDKEGWNAAGRPTDEAMRNAARFAERRERMRREQAHRADGLSSVAFDVVRRAAARLVEDGPDLAGVTLVTVRLHAPKPAPDAERTRSLREREPAAPSPVVNAEATALFQQGAVSSQRGNHEIAERFYRAAIAADAACADAYVNLGASVRSLGRPAEALEILRRGLAVAPRSAMLRVNIGAALDKLGEHEAAMASYRDAAALDPSLASAHAALGTALVAAGRAAEAVEAFRDAVAAEPASPRAHYNLASALRYAGAIKEAIAALDGVLALDPRHADALVLRVHLRQSTCSWEGIDAEVARAVRAAADVIKPSFMLSMPTTQAEQAAAARAYAARTFQTSPSPPRAKPVARTTATGPITIGYLCADYRAHATAYLLSELVEVHDRKRVRVVGLSIGRDDGSPQRARLRAAFDRFVELDGRADARALADAIAREEIDVLVDVQGYSQNGRPDALALRPAPVQVSYLAYAGTLGATFMDYILVDRFVAPPEEQPHFEERLVQLPDSYQVNDRRRPLPAPRGRGDRRLFGLPEDAVVLATFNANHKLTPAMFDIWMRALLAAEGAVLWILETTAESAANLRREAERRGVDAARLVFAKPLPLEQHLPRYLCADLVVDTLPYGAHTTASDALWCACPVVTCWGPAFPSRVATSLLHAVGLGELSTRTLSDYEELLVRLARDPARLAELRRHLEEHRATVALFDTPRFARHIEDAFTEMWRIHEAGEPPRGFAVRATSPAPHPGCRPALA